jgi:hypothetical protein
VRGQLKQGGRPRHEREAQKRQVKKFGVSIREEYLWGDLCLFLIVESCI